MKNLLIAVAFLLAAHQSGLACSCLPSKDAAQELEKAAAVFSGKVVEIKKNEQAADLFGEVEAIIEVEKSWKGVEKQTVSVFTSAQSSACGYGFKTGGTYLVYAFSNAEGRLSTNICTRTRRLKDARQDIELLGPGKEISKG